VKNIRLILATILGLWCWSGQILAENQYPIILVHGFMGWGRDEMGNYRYWGGKYDIEQYLVDQGYTVYTASVGPVSSNWDRAVELFYQIKGGQVDYGQKHVGEFGLIQRPEGKRFPGLYPQWDQDHPVHLVGHSMGGQTIRMLQYLLANVITDSLGNPEKSDLLGKAHSGWIKSITTISTPHNGTTLSDIVVNTVPFLQDFIAVAAVIGNGFYDFDLEQWGFSRKPGELWMDYFRRMRNHPAWKTKNISAWDLSLEGAKNLNTFLTADPTVYYFSFATSSTVLDSSTGRQVPSRDMSFILRANARVMGMKKAYWADGTATDSTWFENDGIVNTVSMAGPTTGANGPDPITPYREGEILIPGQWYFMGKFKADHKQFIGHGLDANQAKIMLERYKTHATRLWSLPE
jgi:triacylglycerol lipase